MWIHKDALAVSEATADGETRYFLNGAMFDKSGRAVATDGHVLLRFTASAKHTEDTQTDPAADVILNANDLKAMAALLPKGKQHDQKYLHIVPNEDRVSISFGNSQREVAINALPVSGTFPQYEKILTMEDAPVATVVFSPAVLEVLCRAARRCNVKSLRMEIRAGERQVLFSGDGDNGKLDGAIMPMRST